MRTAILLLLVGLVGCVSAGPPYIALDRYELEALLPGRTEIGIVSHSRIFPEKDRKPEGPLPAVRAKDYPPGRNAGPPQARHRISYFEERTFQYVASYPNGKTYSGEGCYGFDGDALCRTFNPDARQCRHARPDLRRSEVWTCNRIGSVGGGRYVAVPVRFALKGRAARFDDDELRVGPSPRERGLRYHFIVR